MAQERSCLLPAAERREHRGLGVEGLGELLGKVEPLCEIERELDPGARPLDIAHEVVDAAELGRERDDIGVDLVARQDGEGLFHALDRLVVALLEVVDLTETRRVTWALAWVRPAASSVAIARSK